MKKLYIYTVEGFLGSWDEALEQGKVKIVATIDGKDNKTVEAKAKELYGDSDTYGWTYSAEGLDEAEQVERINLDEGEGEPMTKKEQFADRLEITGDFWRVCQELVNEGWSLGDFEDAGIREVFQNFNNTIEENMECLKGLLNA